ncbi:MAG: hypothetical protein DYG98_10775 [Haliscomenobacteraceae bacterium CHB4]|nr:hypothetical protein [Saprospiraceae bacterium]MCE7923533.1 hypothetical protein [Haliscomenobacteraceae bacterium CHB4]
MNNKIRILIFIVCGILFAALFFHYELSWYESLSVVLPAGYLIYFVTILGKKIAILEVIIMLALLQWLFSAVITYQIFNEYNDLAFLWKTFMNIPAEEYFAFVLPGTLMMIAGLKFPVTWTKTYDHRTLIARAKEHLHERGHIGLWISAIGAAVFFFVPFMPQVMRGAVNFFAQLLYVGLFYILFSKKSKYKGLLLVFVLSITLLNSIMTGMYGELVLWGTLFIIMYLMEYPVSVKRRIGVLFLAVFTILLLQSIKHEYRKETWGPDESRKADFGFFITLMRDRLSDPASLIEVERLFNIAARANQGFLIAQTMSYVPKHEPFAKGETILKSVAAAVTPRLLWPNKPQAGGRDNVSRFLGAPEVSYSYNISPIGEAYVNFGKTGGIVFMFFYGLIFNFFFHQALALCSRYPTIVVWLPLLFVGSLKVEGDLLTTFGSLVKGVMFAFIVFGFSRVILREKI